MRIGIELVQIHPQHSGGCLQLLQGILPPLFLLGHEEEFVLYSAPGSWQPEMPLPANVRVTVLELGGYWYHAIGAAAAADRIDVLFRPFPAVAPTIFPYERMVVLVPDLQHEVLPELFDPEVLAQRRAAFIPAITQAGAVAVLAEHGRHLLEQHYPKRYGEVFLLPPAVTFDETMVERPLSADEAAQIPRQPYFLFPANLWPHKNHGRLIQAFAALVKGRSERVALVLTGDPTRWPELRDSCGHLPVYHLGYVSPRLLAELYRRALALVYFTLFEGFGIPLLEAFHVGTPVLCANMSSLPEVGGDAVLSCDPTDIAAMATLMAQALDDPDLRASLVQKGKARCSHFRWEVSARNLLDACLRIGCHPVGDSLTPLRVVYEYVAQLTTEFGSTNKALHHERTTLREHLSRMTEVCSERLHLLNSMSAEQQLLQTECAARLDIIHQQSSVLNEIRAVIRAQETTLRAQETTLRAQEATIQNLQRALADANAPVLTKATRRLRSLASSCFRSTST